ncbi:uncharacterized protein LOC125861651 [Solanum stenotomum]|uniref:uncharacterized protein LOC125861651 n=1 Tax=Solanum stenotomum TaxID=172797 RepID=UPI0020D0324D|nr:uncharacterized protein LOC125861651 [Solanum stenotomum]
MLHGWVAEKRQRENGSGASDMYYYHKSKQCRSLVEVRKYVFRGLSKLEVDQEITEVKEVIENHSMKRKAECSILERKSATKKLKSNNYGKREVKKFLGGAMNNLMNMNVKHKNKDVGMSEEDSSPKRKIESSILEGEPGIKDQIRILFTPKEKYKREYFLNNLNWCWNHKVQQIVRGLVGDDHRASNGANSGSNERESGREDNSGGI